MQILKNRLVWAALAGITFVTGCKKDDVDNSGTSPNPPVTSTSKINDSVVAYSNEIYLWYKQIPSTFKGSSYAGPEELMSALRQYSTESGFPNPVDRWSFAVKQSEWDNVSSGISGDFGLGVFFRQENDLRVKAVEEQSPAGKAGIRRGWRITKINGSSNITTTNQDFIVNAVFYSNSTTFTFVKPDNTTVDISLNAATYQEHPIYLDTVYNIGSKKIGYLVFNSFLGDTSQIYSEFNRVFNRFTQANVGDVIVDLRYNGGGYVTVQEKLANYLVNSSASGGLMMKQQFNDKYPHFNSTTNFQKLGSLNLNRVFFIVSSSTASASELLINNLKPYMNVKLVGPRSTYGKPVGYFPIDVADWYIFPVSFRTTNKDGQGAYFNGIPVDNQIADGLDKDWGDVEELCLSSALKYITSGAFRMQTESNVGEAASYSSAVTAGNEALDRPNFKGAVDPRGL